MTLAAAIEVDREREVGARLELVHLFVEQEGVSAQIDELLALYEARGDTHDVFVDERFAARDGNHRRAALIDCMHAILEG